LQNADNIDRIRCSIFNTLHLYSSLKIEQIKLLSASCVLIGIFCNTDSIVFENI